MSPEERRDWTRVMWILCAPAILTVLFLTAVGIAEILRP
jgi:hypothetical protein